MTKASITHRRQFRLRVAFSVVVVAVLALGVALAIDRFSVVPAEIEKNAQEEKRQQINDQQEQPKIDSDAQKNQSVEPVPPSTKTTPKAETTEKENLSGSVVYRYSTTALDSLKLDVTETVSFNKEGFCKTSTTEARFASNAEAEEYLAAIESNYGTSYLKGQVTDTVATFSLDVTSNKLDRKMYEDVLHRSMANFTVVRAS